MSIVVTGSIAFDYLMSFPGKFTEHFLPEHMSRVSLSFLVDSMDKRRGGCAPNIAYTLALLGETPRLMAAAGQDFDDYRRWLEAAGVDTSLVLRGAGQVHGVVLLQHRHREQPDRVVLHRRDGECRRAVVSRRRRLPARDHLAERSRRDGAVRGGVPDARHPVHLGSRPAVRADVGARAPGRPGRVARSSSATTTSSSCIRQKTSIDERSVLEHTARAGRDPGRERCSIYTSAGRRDVPAVPPTRIVDPTGVGDAFRAGYMKGLVATASEHRGRVRAWAPSPRPMRSSTSAGRATPSPRPSSTRATRPTSVRSGSAS